MNTLYIGFMWLAYYGLHSAFAADGMKRFFSKNVSFAAPYYRVIYSFFAVVNFVLLGWFHVMVPSRLIFEAGWGAIIAAVVCSITGGILFWKAASKYGTAFLVREDFYEKHEPSQLRKDGVNSLVRHPLYSSILLLLIAFILFSPKWKNLVFALISACYIVIGTLLEERKLVARFGQEYIDYQRNVKMLIPYLL